MTPEETQELRNLVSAELKTADDKMLQLVDDTHDWDAERIITESIPERINALSNHGASLRRIAEKMDVIAGIPIPPQAE